MPCNRPSLRSLTLRANSLERFISDPDTRISLSELQTGGGIDPTEAHHRSVLLKTADQLPTVLAMLELDGVAGRVVLCPPDQAHHLPALVQRAAIDIIVSDEPENGYPTIRAIRSLDRPVRQERPVETEWVLLTSGTTGVPKMAIHSLSSLAGPLEDGVIATGAVWSTFYDIRRYGGIQMLLRALLGGGSMILSSSNEAPVDYLRRVGKAGVTHISGTPSHWRKALMSGGIDGMAPTYVRLSGEIADQAILDHLHRSFPAANIAHAYATTEAGVGFDVRDGKAGFPASLIGDPSRQPELKVDGGTLHIRSSRTASGYIGAPLNGSDGWVDTGDVVKLRDDRYYFAGRKEGVINVGGQKVHPEEVEGVLNKHGAVRMARVWARKSPITGALVAADVVLIDPTIVFADIRDEIIDLCRSHLQVWQVPVTLRKVDYIAITPAGKVARV